MRFALHRDTPNRAPSLSGAFPHARVDGKGALTASGRQRRVATRFATGQAPRRGETRLTQTLLADGYRLVRRFVVFVLGISVLAVGTAMLLLPGPAFLVIPAGLGILALEFEWARRLLRRVREESSAFWKTQDGSGEDATPAEADVVSEKARGE